MLNCDRSQYLFSIIFLVCLKLTVFNPYMLIVKFKTHWTVLIIVIISSLLNYGLYSLVLLTTVLQWQVGLKFDGDAH